MEHTPLTLSALNFLSIFAKTLRVGKAQKIMELQVKVHASTDGTYGSGRYYKCVELFRGY